jgi:hypothetical protein
MFGLYNVYRVGKYNFPTTFTTNDNSKLKTLYVGAPDEIPPGMKVLSRTYFRNGQVGFVIATK